MQNDRDNAKKSEEILDSMNTVIYREFWISSTFKYLFISIFLMYEWGNSFSK